MYNPFDDRDQDAANQSSQLLFDDEQFKAWLQCESIISSLEGVKAF